jgi:hypothetical protein
MGASRFWSRKKRVYVTRMSCSWLVFSNLSHLANVDDFSGWPSDVSGNCMDMSPFRTFVKRGMKIGLPFLAFQIVFLAALPDAFGVDEDFGAITKPISAFCFCCTVDRNTHLRIQIGVPTLGIGAFKQESPLITSACTEKWGCRVQKAPPSDKLEDPFRSPASVQPPPQEIQREVPTLFSGHPLPSGSKHTGLTFDEPRKIKMCKISQAHPT